MLHYLTVVGLFRSNEHTPVPLYPNQQQKNRTCNRPKPFTLDLLLYLAKYKKVNNRHFFLSTLTGGKKSRDLFSTQKVQVDGSWIDHSTEHLRPIEKICVASLTKLDKSLLFSFLWLFRKINRAIKKPSRSSWQDVDTRNIVLTTNNRKIEWRCFRVALVVWWRRKGAVTHWKWKEERYRRTVTDIHSWMSRNVTECKEAPDRKHAKSKQNQINIKKKMRSVRLFEPNVNDIQIDKIARAV